AEAPVAVPSLTLTDVNVAFDAIGAITGPGSQAERRRLLGEFFGRVTEREREFLVRLLTGDLRQGALEGIMTDAVAKAAGVPADEVRRARQLGGWLPEVAQAALGGPVPGGAAADRDDAGPEGRGRPDAGPEGRGRPDAGPEGRGRPDAGPEGDGADGGS